MPARTAATRSYLDRVAGEPWTLTLTVPNVDPATGLVQAAFGAEGTPDPTDATGVHQIVTTSAQAGHSGIIVQRGTTADGDGTAIVRFVIPAADVTAFTPTGMPYSVRVWESAESHWTEQVGWVSSVVPASSLTDLIAPAEPVVDTIENPDPGDEDLDIPEPPEELVLTSITIAPTAVEFDGIEGGELVLTSIAITPTTVELDAL